MSVHKKKLKENLKNTNCAQLKANDTWKALRSMVFEKITCKSISD